jgi:hypothetical protein
VEISRAARELAFVMAGLVPAIIFPAPAIDFNQRFSLTNPFQNPANASDRLKGPPMPVV